MTRDFNLINEAVLKEINRKKEILENDSAFHLSVNSKRRKNLQKESARHSVSIEILGNHGNSSNGKKAKSKEIKRCEKNLFSALEWGLENYNDKLDLDYLIKMGGIVEPNENKNGFRNEQVMISGSYILPPSPKEISAELEGFFINNNCVNSPLEKALHAHFHLARIHPFFDGNGRTSRVIQNIILDRGGFLPITIGMKDRREYMCLIDKAIESRFIAKGKLKSTNGEEYKRCKDKFLKGNISQKEKLYCCKVISDFAKKLVTPKVYEFYNFLALKERDALQNEQERLYKLSKK